MRHPFRVAHENVFVDNNDTKLVAAWGRVYIVKEIRDADGMRFLSVVAQGSNIPISAEERELVLERFALSLIAPKEA